MAEVRRMNREKFLWSIEFEVGGSMRITAINRTNADEWVKLKNYSPSYLQSA